MFPQMRSALLARWGGVSLVSALAGLPLFASCTSSEDTEPFIPAREGAKQPAGSGALVAEDEACERVRGAAEAAYDRLGCQAATLADCPSYLRPGGASGCYEYYEGSVAACEKAYRDAGSCASLAPCIVSAERNDELLTCELGVGGQGGSGSVGGAASGGAGGAREAQGGANQLSEAGAAGLGGAPALGGAGAGGAPALGGAGADGG